MIFLVWHILWTTTIVYCAWFIIFCLDTCISSTLTVYFTWVTFVIIGILKSLCGDFQSNFYQNTPQLTVC